MKNPPVIHGSFTIERTFRASPSRVYAAWADIETKARWFIGPPDRWTLDERELAVRVGGTEVLRGHLTSGMTTLFTARYYAVIPDERLVYVYDMHLNGAHFSTSLATVELTQTSEGGTRMTFTEQAAFYDGNDGTESRREGTDAHFERLVPVLDDARDIVSSRVFDAPRRMVFGAFSDAEQLATWWGPEGFRNTIQELDVRPGGRFRLVMHGPDGADYPNDNTFVDVVPNERFSFRHPQPGHDFTMTQTFLDVGEGTQVIWRMRFDTPESAEQVRQFVVPANEQNFDKLAAHLKSRRA